MPLENARELFIFNIGELRDMETTSARLVSTLADRVQSAELAHTLRELARHRRQGAVVARLLGACVADRGFTG